MTAGSFCSRSVCSGLFLPCSRESSVYSSLAQSLMLCSSLAAPRVAGKLSSCCLLSPGERRLCNGFSPPMRCLYCCTWQWVQPGIILGSFVGSIACSRTLWDCLDCSVYDTAFCIPPVRPCSLYASAACQLCTSGTSLSFEIYFGEVIVLHIMGHNSISLKTNAGDRIVHELSKGWIRLGRICSLNITRRGVKSNRPRVMRVYPISSGTIRLVH